SFLICRWFFMEYLYFYMLSLFGFPDGGVDFWRPLTAISIMTLLMFMIVRTLYTRRLDGRLVKVVYTAYFVVLVYSLLLKNVGLQGVNLNLISFIKDAIFIDPKVPLLNLLIFIPSGTLFKFKYKNIGLFIIAIIAVEVGQNVFHLGFFDIGDIVINTIGFIIGNMIHDSLIGQRIIQSIRK
ncbi:VanZ family protein, partial [Streptococcus suis]